MLEVRPEGESLSRVWFDTYLIRADSPDEAFAKADSMVGGANTLFESAGKQVDYIFRGIGNLKLVLGKLGYGEEIWWTQQCSARGDPQARFVQRRHICV